MRIDPSTVSAPVSVCVDVTRAGARLAAGSHGLRADEHVVQGQCSIRMTHRSANVVHATSQDFDGTSGARTVLVNCPQRPQWNSDGSPARTHNGLPECFSIPRPVRTRTQRDMHYLTRAVPSAVSRAVSSATVRTRTQRGMDYLLLCNILSLAPVLWRGSGMLTEIRRLHAKWPAPQSTACLVWASSEASSACCGRSLGSLMP